MLRDRLAMLAAFALAACDTGLHLGAEISGPCKEAMTHSDFEWVRDNIFAKSCALSDACHRGSRASHLDLTTANALASLVRKPAYIEPDWVRVVLQRLRERNVSPRTVGRLRPNVRRAQRMCKPRRAA